VPVVVRRVVVGVLTLRTLARASDTTVDADHHTGHTGRATVMVHGALPTTEHVFSLMNVRSVPEDLTARARIRHAAIDRFGRDGFGTSIRAIAADADVSPGLVIHHFGSKAALRSECDAHVLETIRAAKTESMTSGHPDETMAQLATISRYAPVLAYVVRSLASGGPLAAAFVAGMIDDAEVYLAAGVESGTIRPSRDPSARARLLVAQSIGSLQLAQLEGEAGRGTTPTRDPARALDEISRATVLPALELYTNGLLTEASWLDAYVAYLDGTPATDPPPPHESRAP
jgi:AcrR family transcriptional regulator